MYIHGSRLFNVGRSGYVGEQSPLLQAPRRHGRHGYRSGCRSGAAAHSFWLQPESGALTRHPKLAARVQARPSTSSPRRSSRSAFRVRAGRTTMHLRSASTLMYGQVQAPGQAPEQMPWPAAEAMALASAINNNSNGLNSAIGGCNFLRVARYSAPKPCGCDTCQD